ncbi:MAG: hypothetical protein HC822_23795 [Oscillochloris sp.]|nr:hypothetical protein [Oscillochloris sp.]
MLALNAPGRDDTVDMMLTTLLESVRNDIRQGLRNGLLDLDEHAPGRGC